MRRLLAPQQRLALRLLWGRRHRLQDVLAACVPGRLDLLARIYGTDKRSTAHGYTRRYEEHLRARRRSVRAVLEIGVGGITSSSGYETTAGGQSLRMWQRYFPRAQIVGLDIEPKRVQGARIHVEQGSQDDPEVLKRIARRYGPFDLIIDDGSHLGRHVEASFEALFAHLNPGGIYAIEDLMTAYRADYEGGPPGTPGTQVDLLKRLVDSVLERHWRDGSRCDAVASAHIYDEIAFIHRLGPPARAKRALGRRHRAHTG
ncbi:MAG: class I SAM-dependent methyltransferase [Microthrixaceae bacterium]